MLGNLHQVLTEEMIKKLQSGEATSGDFKAAIDLLKHNNITSTLDNPDMKNLLDTVGEFNAADFDFN